MTNLERAAARVDYRLNYGKTEEPRRVHGYGISGPALPNAYYGREGHEDSEPEGSGSWEDPEHPDADNPEQEHLDRWFITAVREAVHEAMEWYWVDGKIYLDPHGDHENEIHKVSGQFAKALLALRTTEENG